MDQSLISSLLACGTSIFTCLVAVTLGRRPAAGIIPKQIMEEQLTKLYEPLDKLFFVHGTMVSVSVFSLVSDIILSNYALAPLELIDSYKKLREEPAEPVDCKIIAQIVASNYHWTKKKLHYPYNYLAIEKRYTPSRDTVDNVWMTVEFCLFLVWCVASFFVLMGLTGSLQISNTSLAFAGLIFIIGIIPFIVRLRKP